MINSSASNTQREIQNIARSGSLRSLFKFLQRKPAFTTSGLCKQRAGAGRHQKDFDYETRWAGEMALR
jgi:hypothetical protein